MELEGKLDGTGGAKKGSMVTSVGKGKGKGQYTDSRDGDEEDVADSVDTSDMATQPPTTRAMAAYSASAKKGKDKSKGTPKVAQQQNSSGSDSKSAASSSTKKHKPGPAERKRIAEAKAAAEKAAEEEAATSASNTPVGARRLRSLPKVHHHRPHPRLPPKRPSSPLLSLYRHQGLQGNGLWMTMTTIMTTQAAIKVVQQGTMTTAVVILTMTVEATTTTKREERGVDKVTRVREE